MKKSALITSLGVFTVLIFFVGFWTSKKIWADSTDFNLVVEPGVLSIDAPGALDFGSITTADVSTEIAYRLQVLGSGETFTISDLKGSDDGYYTTLEASDMTGANYGGTIAAANLLVRASEQVIRDHTDALNTNNVLVNADNTLNTYTSLGAAVTFIERKAGPMTGFVEIYHVHPSAMRFKLIVPAFQSIDDYAGTMTFTLFDVYNP